MRNMIEFENGANASLGLNTPNKVKITGIVRPVIDKGNTSSIQQPAAKTKVVKVFLTSSG
jgi:hypothetical protein